MQMVIIINYAFKIVHKIIMVQLESVRCVIIVVPNATEQVILIVLHAIIHFIWHKMELAYKVVMKVYDIINIFN